MAEKSLLSLREIAEELILNYRTMVDIKNQFYSFLPNFFDGRNNKYLPDCVDFFRLIFALKEEGYTSMMIRQILMQRLELPGDNELKEWVTLYIEKYGSRWTEMEADGGRWTGMDEDGWRWR